MTSARAKQRVAVEREPGRRPRGTGAAHVVDRLRDEILSLQLKPSSALDEVTLSDRFGLSRSPIREALIKLAGEGLVTIHTNRTTTVAPFSVETTPHFLDALDLVQRTVTRLAALLYTDRDLKEIARAQARFVRAVRQSDVDEIIGTNFDFHVAIAAAGRNPYLKDFYSRLLNEGKRMLRLHYSLAAQEDSAGNRRIIREHEQIIAAITRRDAEAAEQIAHEHSVQFSSRFVRYIEQNPSAGVSLEDLSTRG